MRKTMLILILTAGLAACGSKGSSSSPTAPSSGGTGTNASISIQGDGYGSGSYTPPQIEVNRGTTVAWTNSDSGSQHTVTSNTGVFDSGSISGGSGYSVKFDTPGTYQYHCTIHPNMTGSVVVK